MNHIMEGLQCHIKDLDITWKKSPVSKDTLCFTMYSNNLGKIMKVYEGWRASKGRKGVDLRDVLEIGMKECIDLDTEN